ncbi:MAG: 6-bladed beta-propeller, partial [Anaerolineae bacterium]|nr:6-bladed beta-propeller [Anaerolineae bacterium]
VSDRENHRVETFDRNGNFLSTWGTWGSENGQFITPKGLTVDHSGYIYVTDGQRRDIQKFAPVAVYLPIFFK